MSHDDYDLTRELDRTKSKVFMGKGTAAFLGPVLCSMEFRWMPEIPTAQTNGRYVGWNPDFFLKLPTETRATVLVHELWHPALLHGLRQGDRDPKLWNIACDIRINNDLENAGFSFRGIEWCYKDHSFDLNGRMAEEDIYDIIYRDPKKQQELSSPSNKGGGSWGEGEDDHDMVEPTQDEIRATVNAVVRAIHEHTISGGAGNIPIIITETLAKFLEPVVPWEKELMQFCTDLLEQNYTWARPNRRYTEVYLPSPYMDEGRLEHIIYYLDVSGSCSNPDVLRFNSEVKYIKEVLKPWKLTIVQFTCEIVSEKVFLDEDSFEETIRYGTGGTSLGCVREHMIKHRPTAAIVFSDLDCSPMQKLPFDLPVIWCAVRATGRAVNFGKLIHIRK